MPNKLSLSIDLLKLTGAVKATIKGEECVVLRLEKSLAKPHQNGAVYMTIEAIENKDGEVKYGNTHWVCEGTTKDQREQGIKGNILGNARTFSDGPKQQPQRQSSPPPQQKYQGPQKEYPEDSDDGIIPF